MFETINTFIPACPNSPGVEGHGEGITYQGKDYYYPRKGKQIPRNKPSYVVWEGFFCGRQKGDREYLLVAFNKEGELLVLKPIYNTRSEMEPFIGMTNEEAIKRATADKEKIKAIVAAYDICFCGKTVMVLDEDQQKHECYECFQHRIGLK